MAMPSLTQIKGPTLQYLNDAATRRLAETSDALADIFKLSEAERNETISSGSQLKWRNRVSWALFELWKAGLVKRPKQGMYEISEIGKAVAAENPPIIDGTYLKRFPEWLEYLKGNAARHTTSPGALSAAVPSTEQEEKTPEERITTAYKELQQKLRKELLDQAREMDPFRFERLVLDLLLAMGYGGSREEAAIAGNRVNDGGIDGLINEDRLGLDRVYVQAKRWQNSVGRPEIQNFVGALAGQHAHKGVFITTSEFSPTAIEYAKNLPQRVILIDGHRLAELMIEHNIGVSKAYTFEIKRIDSDYFEGD